MAMINGTIFDDTLEGTDGSDVISGLGGDDYVVGNSGADTLYGGDGVDTLVTGWDSVGPSTSFLYGGEGSDEFNTGLGVDVSYGGEGNDYFGLSGGLDSIFGGTGTDTLTPYIFNRALNFTLGLNGAGTVTIRVSDDLGFTGVTTYSGIEGLVGSGFNDTLRGNSGNNTFYSATGTDLIFGMAGDDALDGGGGHDTLTGGRGRDAFVFEGNENRRLVAESADVITDFDATQDRLVFFSRNFAGLHTASDLPDAVVADMPIFAVQALEFAVQTTRHAATAGVRVIYDSDDGLLYYDADGALSGYRARLIADIGENHIALSASDIFIY